MFNPLNLLSKFIKSTNQKELDRLQKIVSKINELEHKFNELKNEEFPNKTKEFKERIKKGETLDSLLPEAFACAREAAKRTINERPYDVQIIGSIILHEGKIAEMKTGEGKTLSIALAAYLNALNEEGVHIVTVNDYLAKRDCLNMGQIFNFLGLKSGYINNDQDDYDQALEVWRSGMVGVASIGDTLPGVPTSVVIGYLNYGNVDVWGFDASLAVFLSRKWNMDVTYSYMGTTEFSNPLTKAKESVNSPKHKAGLKLQFNPKKYPLTLSLNGRYVDGFNWSSGIYFGKIKSYRIFDLHLGYEINKYLKMNLTINNLLDHKHIEIIGGPSLGRVMMLRLETKF